MFNLVVFNKRLYFFNDSNITTQNIQQILYISLYCLIIIITWLFESYGMNTLDVNELTCCFEVVGLLTWELSCCRRGAGSNICTLSSYDAAI